MVDLEDSFRTEKIWMIVQKVTLIFILLFGIISLFVETFFPFVFIVPAFYFTVLFVVDMIRKERKRAVLHGGIVVIFCIGVLFTITN
ncbi:MAG TPA: hypothetical protein VK029_02945 [Pseudogracilibacillus sp.]|nr:hypothetical protein [Pseudogracilibacillus sp.]